MSQPLVRFPIAGLTRLELSADLVRAKDLVGQLTNHVKTPDALEGDERPGVDDEALSHRA